MRAPRPWMTGMLVLSAGGMVGLRALVDRPLPASPARAGKAEAPERGSPCGTATVEREGVQFSFAVTPLRSPGTSAPPAGVVLDAAARGRARAGAAGAPPGSGCDFQARGGPVRVTIRARELSTGAPVTGLHPLGWMTRERGESGCTERVRRRLDARSPAAADVELNGFRALTLNGDRTLSVIDPDDSLGRDPAVAELPLSGDPLAWAVAPKLERVYVGMANGHVAVIDSGTLALVQEVAVGGAPAWVQAPGREHPGLVLDVASDRLWTFDPLTGDLRASTEDVGAAAVFVDGEVWVASRRGPTLRVLDGDLRERASLEGTEGISALVENEGSDVAWAFAPRSGVALGIDRLLRARRTELRVGAGATGLTFAPGGRWGFLPFPDEGRVAVVDVARSVVRYELVVPAPDQVTYSNQFAYVRSRTTADAFVVPLVGLGQDAPPVIRISAGRRSPRGERRPIAPTISAVPDTGVVVIGQPADRAVLVYREGMAAPSSTAWNGGRQPLAVAILPRSLTEGPPGTYSTVARLPAPGRYAVELLFDAPRFTWCFDAPGGTAPDEPVTSVREGSR